VVKSPVGVEKGTKAVISANSSAYGELEFNNLRANFFAEIPAKEFFNSHACFRQLGRIGLDDNHQSPVKATRWIYLLRCTLLPGPSAPISTLIGGENICRL